jgi:hypothetical protein
MKYKFQFSMFMATYIWITKYKKWRFFFFLTCGDWNSKTTSFSKTLFVISLFGKNSRTFHHSPSLAKKVHICLNVNIIIWLSFFCLIQTCVGICWKGSPIYSFRACLKDDLFVHVPRVLNVMIYIQMLDDLNFSSPFIPCVN